MNRDQSTRFQARAVAEVLTESIPLESQARDLCQKITDAFSQLNRCYSQLGVVCTKLKNTINKHKEMLTDKPILDNSKVYSKLGIYFELVSKSWSERKQSFEKNISMMFAYSKLENLGISRVSYLLTADHKS